MNIAWVIAVLATGLTMVILACMPEEEPEPEPSHAETLQRVEALLMQQSLEQSVKDAESLLSLLYEVEE